MCSSDLTRKQVLDVVGRYFDRNKETAAVAVISGEGQIAAANKKLNNPMETHRI